jgi:hypothetical protein
MTPDAEGPFGEMLSTVALFLVAQAGRTPLHASAIMMGDTAFVLAGRSGSGKSSLALAADRAGLRILSDDTIYVQIEPHLTVWARPHAIHVFEKDIPQGSSGPLRYRSGRWKRALPITASCMKAERAVLCVLECGTDADLQPLDVEEAIAILTAAPEPGYELYGQRAAEAVRALAQGGCWRMTLSADPSEAIDLLLRRFGGVGKSFHHRYASLIKEIESRFAVDHWRLGDVPIWPLARFDLFVDMHRAAFGGSVPQERRLLLRLGAALGRPLINRWRGRRDKLHQLYKPIASHAAVLGDGVSLDKVDGAYQDRFGEPIVTALEKNRKSAFLIQPGDFSRLPWARATFAASAVDSKALLKSVFQTERADLPQHAEVIAHIAGSGVEAPSLRIQALAQRARYVAAAAEIFERILSRVNPVIGFVVNAAAGLGPAFVLACRRRGILSVDLQRCPRAGAPMSHSWFKLPPGGYATVPSVFWTWDADEPPRLPPSPWHCDLHGGHTQLLVFLDDINPATPAWDAAVYGSGNVEYEREILVALQPVGSLEIWNALADVIAAAPTAWRWWIRRHPAMRPEQDAAFGSLLALSQPNIVVGSTLALPALLRHMTVLVSFTSGAAVEASWFAVPALFLSPEAASSFGSLIANHAARVVAVENLIAEIAALPPRTQKPVRKAPPPLMDTISRLEAMAHSYAVQCAGNNP